MLKKLDKTNFEEEIQSGLKVVEFYAPWCGYCKKQEEVLQEMDKVYIGQVNTDEDAQIAIKYKVNAFPTFIIFKDGKETERFSGFKNKFDLMNIVMKNLN